MLFNVWDYIIVGGGLTGSVISSRMLEYNSSLSILLIEAGEDTRARTDILYTNATNLMGGELDWQYPTEPVATLNNRTLVFNQGKGLGGGAAINSCGYTRGPRVDYDEWAELVGDDRWSYENQLPYMKKAEDWFNSNNAAQHGNGGPLHVASVSSTDRAYPLRDVVASGWDELGVPELPDLDSNAGDNIGRAELTETRRDGIRQLTPVVYPLNGIEVLTETLIEKILLSSDVDNVELQATGVQLANGTQIFANNVISAAGAYRSPQLLMLSGIGEAAALEKHNISVKLDLPEVGRNLIDHMSQPEFSTGYPIDWVTSTGVDKTGLASAIEKDEGAAPDAASHSLLSANRTFLENFVIYQAYSASNPSVPMDGSHIYTNIVSFLPTSRGTVSLASADPADGPMTKLMLNTAFGKEYIVGETAPDNTEPVSLDNTDEYLDSRLAESGVTTWHPHGSCAMGSVVDSNFKVKGVKGLRVVDASVLPVPIAAHLMAPLYAMAEQAASIITGN
ncbi:hypothetical protein K4K60_001636 [Colletotrichum sp. SAR11_57]|nr:hypothetical protein K4K60_001636 [Colletotrichum sp. SAR11_57]